ncbi:hypothetical protein GCM10028801_29930 [Nocardioides maradonensis]
MTVPRSLATAGILGTTLALAACGSSPKPAPTPTTSSPAPAASASADPAGSVVPLGGDGDLRFVWKLDAGVDPHDPVIDVARRTIVLMDLGYQSPSWTDRARMTKASAALTTADVVTPREISEWTDPHKRPAVGLMRMLVTKPMVDGAKATVFTCTQLRGVPSISQPVGGDGVPTWIELAARDGVWRVTRYDNNAEWATAGPERRFTDRCSAFGKPPNPLLGGG